MGTTNKSTMPCKVIMTEWAVNGSSVGIAIGNSVPCSYRFVVNEGLHPPEIPLMHPFVVSASSPNVCQIFHHDCSSCWNTLNDSPAYVVVSPCHKPRPSSAKFLQMPFSRFGAFGLKFANQPIMLNSQCLDVASVEFAIGSNSKVVYADINSENSILEIRAFGINIFSKCKEEITSAPLIHSQEALSWRSPTEVFSVAVWDGKLNFNSAFDCSNAQDIVLEGSRTGEVVPNGAVLNSRLSRKLEFSLSFSAKVIKRSVGLADHLYCLPATAYDKLCLEFCSFEMSIDSILQPYLIPDFIVPCEINAVLQGLFVDSNCMDYFSPCWNFDFSCGSYLHRDIGEGHIYKSFENEEDKQWQFLPTLKGWASLPNAL